MNHNRLKERQVLITATPMPNKASSGIINRRQLPKNILDKQDPIDQAYSTFFDFEEDLSNLKSSAQLFEEVERKKQEKEISKHTILEEVGEVTDSNYLVNNTNNVESVYTSDSLEEFFQEESEPIMMEEIEEVKTYESQFIQCEFIKQDGERCKRQAPKNHKLCSKHKI
jgi:hypothetical protein